MVVGEDIMIAGCESDNGTLQPIVKHIDAIIL